jgi:plastocyanin
MKLRILTIALLALASPAPGAPAGGTVTGHVIARKERKSAPIDDVWVYLEHVKPRRKRSGTTAPPAREIRQEKETFSPHVLVVAAGTTIAFPNYDRQEHNVFSPSDPPGQFDLGRYNTDHKGKTHTFEDPADVEIYCDIHKSMWARVKVVDTEPELIAKVDAAGNYSIAAVPAGKYRLHVWSYDSQDEDKQDIDVGDGASVTAAEAHVQVGTWSSEHLRKDGTTYIIYKPH